MTIVDRLCMRRSPAVALVAFLGATAPVPAQADLWVDGYVTKKFPISLLQLKINPTGGFYSPLLAVGAGLLTLCNVSRLTTHRTSILGPALGWPALRWLYVSNKFQDPP